MRLPVVGRNREIGTFVTSLESPPQQAASILLVEDASGQGKTRLLEIYSGCCREHRIPFAHVDLKGGSLSPLDILWSIQTDLRPFLSLPRCAETLRNPHMTSPSFSMCDNKALGQTSYTMHNTVNLTGLSLDEQKRWWAFGAQAFLEDLLEPERVPSLSRLVLLFDTFEQAKAETKAWIADHVLRMATPNRVSCLVIVVAGRQVPDPTGEWAQCCEMIPLQPLQLGDWLEYARGVKSSVLPEQMRACYAKHGTRPLEMAKIIDALIIDAFTG